MLYVSSLGERRNTEPENVSVLEGVCLRGRGGAASTIFLVVELVLEGEAAAKKGEAGWNVGYGV